MAELVVPFYLVWGTGSPCFLDNDQGWMGGSLLVMIWNRDADIRQSTLYDDKMPAPPTDPYHSLPHFAGGIPMTETDFRPLLTSGRIASFPLATLQSVDADGVKLQTRDGVKTVQCGAIVAATGYAGSLWDFIDLKTQVSIGLNKVPPKSGYEARVRTMRARWPTVLGDEVVGADQALVYRGVLPAGRYHERDLAIAGGTRREWCHFWLTVTDLGGSVVFTCKHWPV